MVKKMSSEGSSGISQAWKPQDAEGLYNIPQWGEGYFGVNAAGHLRVRPYRERSPVEIGPPAPMRSSPTGASRSRPNSCARRYVTCARATSRRRC